VDQVDKVVRVAAKAEVGAKAGIPPEAAEAVVKVARVAEAAAAVKAAQVVPEVQADLADRAAASGSISARRKCASSASRRWISSTISARTFFRSSCRNAARFCLVG
jgi:hypothetical protein